MSGTFGLAQVKHNLTKALGYSLSYDIIEMEPGVPAVEWVAKVGLSPDELVYGPPEGKGPAPDKRDSVLPASHPQVHGFDSHVG